MSHLKSFLKSKSGVQKKIEKKKEEEKEKQKSKSLKLIEDDYSDSDSSDSKDSKNKKSDVESLSESMDEERMTLGHINKYAEISRKKKEEKEKETKSFLNRTRLLYEPIKYIVEKKELYNTFCPSPEELNEFLIHCKIQTLSLDEILMSQNDDTDYKTFNIDEWMKSNKIEQRTINAEELYTYNKNRKVRKEIEINQKYVQPQEKQTNPIHKHFDNPKIQDNYDRLQEIKYSKILSWEQKAFLNDLFQEMGNTDIKSITIEKDREGKDNKLELVLDLDNTCIYSYLYDKNALYVQDNQKKFHKKKAKIISFQYKDFVLYNVLILREGLEEFLKYVLPICNFHISTLGTKNYGKEIANIFKDSFGIEFKGFKGKLDENECTKYISDLYIKKEKTVIIDDNANVWEKDSENIIISKFFFDEECSMIKREKPKEIEDKIDEINAFLNSYNYIFYNNIIEKNNDIDWKIQTIKGIKTPFYQFNQSDDYNYNKCFTAEYLNSKNFQFIYLKNIIKEIYLLKFIYDVEIPLAIKMIRMSTLANMKFDVRFLSNEERNILTSIIKVCGGIIFEGEYVHDNEKIYLVASKRIYELDIKRKEIKTDLKRYPYYILLNEKFILDTFYLCSDLRTQTNDPEYTYEINS